MRPVENALVCREKLKVDKVRLERTVANLGVELVFMVDKLRARDAEALGAQQELDLVHARLAKAGVDYVRVRLRTSRGARAGLLGRSPRSGKHGVCSMQRRRIYRKPETDACAGGKSGRGLRAHQRSCPCMGGGSFRRLEAADMACLAERLHVRAVHAHGHHG